MPACTAANIHHANPYDVPAVLPHLPRRDCALWMRRYLDLRWRLQHYRRALASASEVDSGAYLMKDTGIGMQAKGSVEHRYEINSPACIFQLVSSNSHAAKHYINDRHRSATP